MPTDRWLRLAINATSIGSTMVFRRKTTTKQTKYNSVHVVHTNSMLSLHKLLVQILFQACGTCLYKFYSGLELIARANFILRLYKLLVHIIFWASTSYSHKSYTELIQDALANFILILLLLFLLINEYLTDRLIDSELVKADCQFTFGIISHKRGSHTYRRIASKDNNHKRYSWLRKFKLENMRKRSMRSASDEIL